jgi:hypothetical protein
MSGQRGGTPKDITKDACCYFYCYSAITLTESSRTHADTAETCPYFFA